MPDWRLGQLIANATRSLQHNDYDCDPFYVEDDVMVEAINNLFTDVEAA